MRRPPDRNDATAPGPAQKSASVPPRVRPSGATSISGWRPEIMSASTRPEPQDIVQPGHIFPLAAMPGGVLSCTGQRAFA